MSSPFPPPNPGFRKPLLAAFTPSSRLFLPMIHFPGQNSQQKSTTLILRPQNHLFLSYCGLLWCHFPELFEHNPVPFSSSFLRLPFPPSTNIRLRLTLSRLPLFPPLTLPSASYLFLSQLSFPGDTTESRYSRIAFEAVPSTPSASTCCQLLQIWPRKFPRSVPVCHRC